MRDLELMVLILLKQKGDCPKKKTVLVMKEDDDEDEALKY